MSITVSRDLVRWGSTVSVVLGDIIGIDILLAFVDAVESVGMKFEHAKWLFIAGLIAGVIGNFTFEYDYGATFLLSNAVWLAGVYYLAEWYRSRDIFKNSLYSFIVSLIYMYVIYADFLKEFAEVRELEKKGVLDIAVALGLATDPLLLYLGFLILSWPFLVVSSYFLRRAFRRLGEVGGVGAFNTAAKLIWIGAWISVIFVGYFIIMVGYIFSLIGAFGLKQPQKQATDQSPPPPGNAGFEIVVS